jgi:hypothetical protein
MTQRAPKQNSTPHLEGKKVLTALINSVYAGSTRYARVVPLSMITPPSPDAVIAKTDASVMFTLLTAIFSMSTL